MVATVIRIKSLQSQMCLSLSFLYIYIYIYNVIYNTQTLVGQNKKKTAVNAVYKENLFA